MGELLFPIHEKIASFSWRQYQLAVVEAVKKAITTSNGCLIVLPCGVGKTEIAVLLIQALVAAGRAAMVITPLHSLVEQTAARLRLRGVCCGIEEGPLQSTEPITVASYKSLISRNRYIKFVGNTDLVIVDESHLNYSKRAIEILTALRDSGAKIIGMTASPDRMSGDPLTEFYGGCAYHYGLLDAINDGWLVPPKVWIVAAGELRLDAPVFQTGQQDFPVEALCEEMARESLIQTQANLVLQHHEGEPCVVFCQGILQAEKLRIVLHRGGLEAAIVHSKMDTDERALNLHLFDSGKVNVILNVGCLTVGWDCPIVRKLFMFKPTKSRNLYQQALGRGTRPLAGTLDGWATAEQRRQAIADSGKPFFEVFDLVDASRHNDLQTAVEALAPCVPPEIARVVRKKAEQEQLPLTEIGRLIAEEQALIEEQERQAAQQRAALEALRERQRAAWLAGVDFDTCERDAFLPAEERPKERGWRVKFGKYKGTLLRDVDTGWLRWALAKSNAHGPYRQAIETELRRRTG